MGGVHPLWATMLLDSVIASRDIRRRGVIIDYRKTTFTVLVPYLIQYNMPIVLRIDEKTMHKYMSSTLEARIVGIIKKLGYSPPSREDLNRTTGRYIPPPGVIARLRQTVSQRPRPRVQRSL